VDVGRRSARVRG